MTESTRAWLRELNSFPADLPGFDVAAVPDDPVELFLDWLRQAVDAGVLAAHGGVLGTSDAEGVVSGRILVLKDVEPGAWRVATPTDGQTGAAALQNPHAAITFFWPTLGRQVKAAGRILLEPRDLAIADFRARPRDARVTTLVGRPTAELSGEREYVAARADAEARLDADPNLVPSEWALWRLEPTSVEFWQAAHSREHVRLRYRRTADRWHRGLLWP